MRVEVVAVLALQSGQRRSASATFGVSDRACSDSYRSIFTGAYEVAAAGRHHMLSTVRLRSATTMLAERVPGLLPDLDARDALEV